MSFIGAFDDKYKIISLIEKNENSEVYLTKDITNDNKSVVKVFESFDEIKFQNETQIMKDLDHINLVNLISFNKEGTLSTLFLKRKVMYLTMNYASNGSLFDYIYETKQPFSEIVARSIFIQLLSGVYYLHHKKIAHRDLKTENIMLDDEFKIKIGDFGFSTIINPSENKGLVKHHVGTVGYQSPQLLEHCLYDGISNDLFACGVILFILVNAYPPFKEASKRDSIYKHIYNNNFEEFWKIHKDRCSFSEDLKHLLTGLLRYKNRWSMEEIIDCKWIKNDVPTYDEYYNEMNLRKCIVNSKK